MSMVLDASLTLTWFFADERTKATDALLDQTTQTGAIVPPLWRLEIANAFLSAIRRNRIDETFRDRALTQLARLPITIDPDCDPQTWTTTIRLADRLNLTIYDATYLELAQRHALPLATLDTQLRQAAQSIGLITPGI